VQADPVQQLLKRIEHCASGAEDAMWNQGAAEQLAGIRGVLELADELRGHLAELGAPDDLAPGYVQVPRTYWRPDERAGGQVVLLDVDQDNPDASEASMVRRMGLQPVYRRAGR
jgi:hypothetical protein